MSISISDLHAEIIEVFQKFPDISDEDLLAVLKGPARVQARGYYIKPADLIAVIVNRNQDDIGAVRVVPDKGTVVLGCYDIVVTHDGKGGAAISSSLGEVTEPGKCEADELAVAIDTVESMILAAACAGLKIEDPMFLEVIETVVSKIGNEYG